MHYTYAYINEIFNSGIMYPQNKIDKLKKQSTLSRKKKTDLLIKRDIEEKLVGLYAQGYFVYT